MKTKLQDRLKKQNGITLIALVVTIVVLIILAMISVRVVFGEEGLIERAKKASTTQDYAEAKEVVKLALQDAVIAKKAKGTTLEEYLIAKFGAENVESTEGGYILTYQGYEFEIKSDYTIVGDKAPSGGKGDDEGDDPEVETVATLLELWESGELEQGDYVTYTPTGAASYDPDQGTVGSLTGYSTAQSISRDNLNWRVLGKDEDNNILLISELTTTSQITFHGVTGFNNFVDVLNDTCNALYSNQSLGVTARHLNSSDFVNYTGSSIEWRTYNLDGSKVIMEDGSLKLNSGEAVPFSYECIDYDRSVFASSDPERIIGGPNWENSGVNWFMGDLFYAEHVDGNTGSNLHGWCPCMYEWGMIKYNNSGCLVSLSGGESSCSGKMRPVLIVPGSTSTEDMPLVQ